MANRELNTAVAAETTLGASLTDSATTLTVASSSGFPSVDFPVVLDADDDSKREVVIVTNVSGTTWTVTRGEDGTSGVAHDPGAMVALTAVPSLWGDLHDRVEAHTHGGGTDGTAVDASDLTGHTEAAHTALNLLNESAHDALDHSALTGIPVVVSAVKTADETISSSTTIQNDDHLTVAVEASSYYAISVFLHATIAGSGGGLDGAFSLPSGATLVWSETDSAVVASGTSERLLISSATGASDIGIEIAGYIYTGGTAGNLRFRWAQNASDSNGVTIKKGSWLRAEKIA